MTAAAFTSPWRLYAHGPSRMMPFSTRFLQGVPGNSDCINSCAENILVGEANPAAPVPNEPDLPADGEALRDEQELLIDRIETQRMLHTKVHRQWEIAPEISANMRRCANATSWPSGLQRRRRTKSTSTQPN